MSVQTIKLVEDNTAPPQVFTLQRDGTAINVTGATVSLIIKQQGGSITNTGHQTCTLTTPASGIVTYNPQSGDFPDAGSYIGDIKIVYADTTMEILYDQIKFKARSKIT